MTKSMKKDFSREVRYSFSRYLSILLIVVLGVAFFSGIRSSAPAMKESADATYDAQNFMDISVMGTLGITDADISEILKIAGVEDAEGQYTANFLCSSPQAEAVTTVLSLTDRVNLVKVSEGRYPEKYNECIADKQFLDVTGYKLGDTIKFTTGNEDDLTDTLVSDEYVIVGVGTTAYYLNSERGTASIGNGRVDGFVILPKEAFSLSCYTQALLKVAGAQDLNCFSSKYEKLVDRIQSNVSSIADTRCNVRYDEFKQESITLITNAEMKFETERQKAYDEFESAYQQLSDANTALAATQAELDLRKKEIEDAQALLDMQESNADENRAQIDTAKATVEQLQAEYNTTSKQLAAANTQIAEMEKALKENASNMTNEEYANQAFTVYSYKATAQVYKAQLDAIGSGINQAKAQITAAEAILDGSPEAIAAAREKFANGDAEIREFQKTLNDKQYELDLRNEEYELSKEDITAELEDAQTKLNNYKTKIDNISVPEWHVVGREAVESFASFKNDADGISAIGAVFPVIFFIVAALVSLTTMTRMVEEQRTQIGTMKALGYSKKEITRKYTLYACTATLLGSVVGVLLGEGIIPELIVRTYKLMYVNMTRTVIMPNIPYAVIAMVIAVACTTGAAFLASYKFLKETPASLMRPEAPKIGKKIFLEKIDGIWLRLNFAQKAACRNMFRYKKRLFMTLFGVAGSMALLLVGFGIRDSVASMTDNQFNGIWNYQGTVTVNESLSRTERRHLLSEVQKVEGVDDYLQTFRTLTYAGGEKDEESAYILVPQNVEYLSEYITLESRVTNKAYTLDDSGVIITEKLAKMLNVSVGDTITLKADKDGTASVPLTVTGIVENYLYHYVYMTPTVYKNTFGESASLNTLLLRSSAQNDEELAKSVLEIDGITSVTMNSKTQAQVDSTMKNLIMIVALMIVSAGLLAFVVLYNLNNINITERKRELATLKVLGFYNNELERYVYRENIILTILGMIIGTVIGAVLHFFVMKSVETDTLMFGQTIKWYSYIFSILLTAAFSVMVNFIMSFKLKKIDMVESLKSIE